MNLCFSRCGLRARLHHFAICGWLMMVCGAVAAQRTWDGGGGDSDWRTAQNWDGSIFLPIPIAQGDSLVFPEGPTKLSNTNDFGAGTNFTALTFSGDDYIVRGNRIGLTNGISVTHASGGTTLYLPITLRDDQSFTVSSASAFLYLSGIVDIGLNTLTFDGAGNCVLIGEITNGRLGFGTRNQVRKNGTGRLTIFQPTDHDVPTIVNGGILAVEHRMTNSAVTVNAGGTLRGSGKIGALNGNGGLIQPGGTTPDALECFGDVTLGAGTTLRLRLNGTTAGISYDQLEVKGAVTVGGTLEISAGFLPAVGDRFTIIDNDGTDDVIGTFAGLPEGAEFTLNGRPFKISYGDRFGGFGRDVNDVTIEAIPAVAIWDGGGGLNKFWSEPLNWVGDVVPTPGDNVQFGNAGPGTLTAVNDLPAGSAFGSIIFGGGDHRLEGNLIQLHDGISMNFAGDVELFLPLTISGSQVFRLTHSNAFLRLNAAVDIQSSSTLTIQDVYATHDGLNESFGVVMSNVISGPGRLRKTGVGRWYLSGTITCSETILDGGNLYMHPIPGSVISGALTVNSGATVDSLGDCTGQMTVNVGGLFSGGGVMGNVDVYGELEPGSSMRVTGALRMHSGSTYVFRIFDQGANGIHAADISVSGPAQLTNCNFRVSLSPTNIIIPIRSQFGVIRTDGTAITAGVFNGLPEGAHFMIGRYVMAITYRAGSGGNDILLTVNPDFVWDGGGSGNLATTAANWTSDFTPIPDTALVFPAGVTKLGVLQDFPANTRFHSLTFSGPSYVFAGNSFRLSQGLYNDVASGDTTIIADVVTVSAGSTFTNRVGNGSRLIVEGGVAGTDTWRKSGAGALRFTGALSNNLSGVDVREGELELDKPDGVNAIARALSIGDGTNDVRVTLLNDNQIDDSADVTIRNRARLDLNGNNETIDGVQGDGTVSLTGRIVPGRSGRLTVNSGSFSGDIVGDGGLTKTGSPSLTLSGQNTFSGTTIINGGTLNVSGSLASAIRMDGGVLRGSGSVGAILGNLGGTVMPGITSPTFQNSFQCGNVQLNSTTVYHPLLTSVDPGYENSYLQVAGSVSLGGAMLVLSHGFNFTPPTNKTFIILENDGSDAISGTFAGLPEGAIVGGGSFAFRVSYVGGSGNDVTVTRVAAMPSDLTSIQSLGSGRVMIQGLGIPGQVYDVQAASNLHPVISWSVVGRGTGDSSGAFQFIHSNAPAFRQRYYRAVTP